MATGDSNDVVSRVFATLPPWFPDLTTAPILNSILQGIGDAYSFVYSYLQFATLQTRIKTATGGWLDLIAWDFFGSRFLRRSGEADAIFQGRILVELLRPRATRGAVIEAVTDLTGVAPLVCEPWNTNDCGAYGIGTSGYGVAGCYGSISLPNQIFLTVQRPPGAGVPNVGGYGVGGLIGYGVAGELADLSQMAGPIPDSEIYETIAQTVAAGITAWVDIVDSLPKLVEPVVTLDESSITLDSGSITLDTE